MISFKPSSKLDNVGMAASILCAVHCAIVPVLITGLPLLGIGFLANPWIEWGMIIFAMTVGVYAIGSSYLKVHKKALPVGLFMLGFLVILSGHLLIIGLWEALIVPIGGLLVAAAHFFNYRYSVAINGNHSFFHINHAHHH